MPNITRDKKHWKDTKFDTKNLSDEDKAYIIKHNDSVDKRDLMRDKCARYGLDCDESNKLSGPKCVADNKKIYGGLGDKYDSIKWER